MNYKLIIATGGTGGHFFPSVAIAHKLKEHGGEVSLYLNGKHSSEQKKLAEKSALKADIGKTFPWPVPWYKKLYFLFGFYQSLRIAQKFLQQEKPDAVLAMGSFASVPLGLAASFAGIPLFLHDGNTIAGRANRLLSDRAQCLFHSFPLANEVAIKCSTFLSGVPLRPELLKFALNAKEEKNDILARLNLSSEKKTLLIFGGSQGAQFINNILIETIKLRKAQNFQIIHLTGTAENQEFIDLYQKQELSAYVAKQSTEIEKLYSVADLVLCRGGASTLAELAIFAKPAIIIPLPSSMDNHQLFNAQMAETANAAMMLKEKNCTSEKLLEIVETLLEEDKLSQMSECMQGLATPDAAENLLKKIETLLTSRQSLQ